MSPRTSLDAKSRCCQLVLALGLSLALGSVSPAASAESRQDRADALFLQGKAAAQAKHWDEAHRLLKEAWQLKQSYDIASNLGQVAYLLGKHAEAAQHVSFALAHYPPTADTEQKQKAESLLELVRGEVASIRLSVSHPDAEILVDGQPQGRAALMPAELFVEPGQRRVVARLDSERVERVVRAEKGGQYQVQLNLSPEAPAPPVVAAAAPAPGGSEASGPADSAPDPSSPTSGLEPKHVALIVGGGLTLVSGVGFAVFAIQHSRAVSDIDSYHARFGASAAPNACNQSVNNGDCQKLKDAVDARERSGRLRTVFLASGVGFAGATLLTYLLWPDSPGSPDSAQLNPMLTPESQGLLLSGSF